MRVRTLIHILAATVLATGVFLSCDKDPDFNIDGGGTPGAKPSHEVYPVGETRRAMILVSAGFNDLSPYLKEDIEDLRTSAIPPDGRSDDLVFIFSRQPVSYGSYSVPTAPCLIRLYQDHTGEPVMDTLLRLNTDALASSPESLGKVLSYIKDNYPASSYGMVLSSHGSGWVPPGYYYSPTSFENKSFRRSAAFTFGPVAYEEEPRDPSRPAVKSICQDKVGSLSYEISIPDFAACIPMHMDYILLDACLMGCVEVAWELKDVCDKVGFSQTEVLAQGFNYETMTSHLLAPEIAPVKVCSDYFDSYASQSGELQSATISFIDCTALDPLAAICKELFERYRGAISTLNPSRVQRYFRNNRHWFYDLKDILDVAGITPDEQARLQKALDGCMLYKNATPRFLNEFEIRAYSGLSMYLPANGSAFLNSYYQTLRWNQATELVKSE